MDDKGKKTKLSAPQYIDYVMTFVQKTINDETIFPTKHGNFAKNDTILAVFPYRFLFLLGVEFPSTFDSYLKKTHRLLFHVTAHVYHAHFKVPNKNNPLKK